MKRFFVAAVFLLLPSYLLACSCGFGPPCRVLEEGSAVFVGRTLSSEMTPPEDQRGGSRLYPIKFTFSIKEAFRGVSGSLATVYTTRGGGSCGYRFEIGKEYLIFARNEDGVLATSICSKTQPVGEAVALLKQLRTLASGKTPAAAFGVLFRSPKPLTDDQPRPLHGVAVVATGPSGEKTATETDASGAFEFHELPQGTVELRPILPTGLVTRESMGSDVSRVEIKAGAACENNFPIFADGHISGQILFGNDISPSGMVQIFAGDLDPMPIGLSLSTISPSGAFKIPVPWAGKYGLRLLNREGKVECDLDTTFSMAEGQKIANVVVQACKGPKK